jgi:hypothetical protein
MKALHATALGLKFGVAMAAAAFAGLRLLGPAFFSTGGEGFLFVGGIAAATALLGLLLGLLFGEVGGALAAAAVALPLGGGFGLLLLHDVTVGSALGAAAAAFVVVLLLARTRFARGGGGTIALLGLSVVLLAVGVARRPPPSAPPSDHAKIFVFGLDAGTWTILDELFAKDELPNLRKVRDEGASGVLQSELKSESSRVWTTIATGKLPEKKDDPKAGHGIVDFYRMQNRDLRTRRVWEILHLSKKWTVGLFQWLVTWPPDPGFEPFVVPGWDARGPETLPPALSFVKDLEMAVQTGEMQGWVDRHETSRLLAKVQEWARGYLASGLRLSTLARAGATWFGDPIHPVLGRYSAKRKIQLLLNGDVFLQLYRTTAPDFSCFICYGTDNLAHKFWQYHFPDDFGMPHEQAQPYRDVLTDYYRDCDRLLGEILPLLPTSTTLAVLSDHGFTSVGENGESHQQEHRPRTSRIARLLDLTDDEVKPSSIATHGYFHVEESSGRGEEIGRKLLAFLQSCTVANGGPKIFTVKVDRPGEFDVAMNTADGTFRLDMPIDTPQGPMTYGDLADIEDRTGNHSIKGIVLLRGPHVRKGVRIEGARLLDVTPTLLYLEEQPVGADMDGTVLLDAVEPAYRDEHDVERIKSWDDVVTLVRDASATGDDSAFRAYAGAIGYIGDNGDSQNPRPRPPKQDPPKPPPKVRDGKDPKDASSDPRSAPRDGTPKESPTPVPSEPSRPKGG